MGFIGFGGIGWPNHLIIEFNTRLVNISEAYNNKTLYYAISEYLKKYAQNALLNTYSKPSSAFFSSAFMGQTRACLL